MKEIIKSNRELKKLVVDISKVAGFMWDRGWAERNAGNISVNISSFISHDIVHPDNCPHFNLSDDFSDLAGSWFIVTGTGSRMRDLAKKPFKNSLLVKVDDTGKGYFIISSHPDSSESFMPTSELPTHFSIHRMIKERGSEETVVTHTHASELIAITQVKEYCEENRLNKLLWGMHPETMVFVPKGVGFVPYVTPGTNEIATATLEALRNHDVALWEKHGVFAIGKEIYETFDVIDILAKSAKIFFMCKNAGHEPEGLTDEQLEELSKIVF